MAKISSTSEQGLGAQAGLLRAVEGLFFLSGAAALAYQVCWQRILFFSFGTDVESTTIIVSVFMMGLGLGALLGGWMADKWPQKIALCFALFELGIGAFGAVSPWLLEAAAGLFTLSGRGVTAFVNFALLLPPTAMMGATLPMLITLCLRVYKNVGVSTGTLYCLNTLGAATGCALAVLAFRFVTLDSVIIAAVAANIFVAAVVFLSFRGRA